MGRFRGGTAFLLACGVLGVLPSAQAEIFKLRSGGQVEGAWVNRDDKSPASYVIALPDGGQVTLDAAVVERVQTVRPELADYEKMRQKAPDTVDGQMALAKWCFDHSLPEQRKTHLERVLQLDPDQSEARHLLGYRKVKEQWMTHDEEMLDKGYVKRMIEGDARWLTPQEAENRDSVQKQLGAEREWRKKLSQWRAWLDGKRGEVAKQNILAIEDPMATVPLGERLEKDPRADVRLMYVEVLGNLSVNTHQARGPLSIAAIDDPEEEVRLSCLDALVKAKDEAVTKYFVGRMKDKHASDTTIDRAGVALGKLKDPSAVGTLVNYVYYSRTTYLPPPGGQGAMGAAFGRGPGAGGGGLSMNQKPRPVTKMIECQGVHDALVDITGQDFGYDPVTWQRWYSNQIAAGAPIAKQ